MAASGSSSPSSSSASQRRKMNLEVQIPENHLLLPLLDFNWHFQSIVTPSPVSSRLGSPVFHSPSSIFKDEQDEQHEDDEEEALRRGEFFRVFKAFDENDDGLVSKEEVQKMMAKLGHQMSESDLDLLMLTVDLNGDGCVDFDEFHALYSRFSKNKHHHHHKISSSKSSSSSSDYSSSDDQIEQQIEDCDTDCDEEDDEEENLMDAFRIFDKNNDGFITAEELHSVLSNLGFVQGESSIAACRNMISGVDSNGDGLVDFVEFRDMMLARPSPRASYMIQVS